MRNCWKPISKARVRLDALKPAVKAALESLRSIWRRAELKNSAPHVTRASLAADLRRLGIAPGDCIFLHSSLKSLGFVVGGPIAVIGALQDVLGADGTLLLPTYYLPGGTILATCEMKDYVFDPRLHGTNMGALPAAFLATAGVCRSLHPTHSVAALGHHAQHLTEAHHLSTTVFGEGSPWQRFTALPASKVLGLGISMGPVTFYHLLEDRLGEAFPLPVWLGRTYRMPCRDDADHIWQVPVRPFDPVLASRRIDTKGRDDLRAYFSAEFERAGLKQNGQVGNTGAWTIGAQAFLDHLEALAHQGITIYATPDELAARPLPNAASATNRQR